ncbi:lipocalin family protein [Chloroflexi bacterium TSY]|nr:lipocalin family protein [Chloroflexi bacterium TSY]
MDHEFGTIALSNGARGWDWFSVTLDNGMVFMFGELQNGKGEGRFLYGGTLAHADGRQFSLGQDDFEINSLEEWTSPRSKITYPSRWLVRFPTHNIELEIEPIIADQEMDVSFIYYEGATRVTGMMNGEEIQGQGYVELTGYSNQSQD